MATYKKLVTWKRWHGSLADVGDVARQALELLHDEKDGSENGHRESITVVVPGLETTFGSPDEFEREVLQGDLARIEAIRVAVDSSDEAQAIVLTINRESPALTLDVRGTSRKEVEGVAEVLRDRLNRGRRVSEKLFTWGTVGFGVFFLVAWFALIFLWEDAPWGLGLVGFFAGVAWVIPAVVLNKLVPPLELLPPGTRTRWDRSRKWLVRTAYTGVGVAATAAIGAAAKAFFS
jgi:hypothetical protein